MKGRNKIRRPARTVARERVSRTVFGASCLCFDMGLTCHHAIKERTSSIPDSTIPESPARPEWASYHSVERMQNTQRYKAG